MEHFIFKPKSLSEGFQILTFKDNFLISLWQNKTNLKKNLLLINLMLPYIYEKNYLGN